MENKLNHLVEEVTLDRFKEHFKFHGIDRFSDEGYEKLLWYYNYAALINQKPIFFDPHEIAVNWKEYDSVLSAFDNILVDFEYDINIDNDETIEKRFLSGLELKGYEVLRLDNGGLLISPHKLVDDREKMFLNWLNDQLLPKYRGEDFNKEAWKQAQERHEKGLHYELEGLYTKTGNTACFTLE